MKRATSFALLLAALAGCGSYTPDGNYGYRLRHHDVRFMFRPRRYPWTAFAATGDSVALRDLRVRRVSVELFYADGGVERIALRNEEGGHERRVRLTRFEGRPLAGFCFLVNDRFRALPPVSAANRIEPTAPGKPVLLGLDLTPERRTP